MVREICRDTFFLAQKAAPAAADDLGAAQDLLDTLAAHRDGCVGMAANMIGVNKRIIAVDCDGAYLIRCTGCVKDEDGNVTEVLCTYDPDSRGGDGGHLGLDLTAGQHRQ